MKIKVPLCRHLKTKGTQCQSPAMEYSEYCYFHQRLHDRHKTYRYSKETEKIAFPTFGIRLHALEDAESIQMAISLVVNALAVGNLETKEAATILYGLQLASSNLRNLAKPDPQDVVREVATTNDGRDCASKSGFLHLVPDPETAERLEREAAVLASFKVPSVTPALPSVTKEII